MNIIKANENQYDSVRCFYHSLIEGMQKSPYDIGWKKDIYPSPEFLQESIAKEELYKIHQPAGGYTLSCLPIEYI